MRLLSILSLVALASVSSVAAANSTAVEHGYVAYAQGMSEEVEYCRPVDIVWYGYGPINVTISTGKRYWQRHFVKNIATNTYDNVSWVVDMPRGQPEEGYWISLIDGSASTLSFLLNTTNPANSSCDQSLLELPFDAASLQSAAERRGQGGATRSQLALVAVSVLGLVGALA